MRFDNTQNRWANCLLTLIVCGSIPFASCATPGPKSTETTGSETVSSTPPFSTKEPDTYQAIRKLTFTDSDGNSKTIQTEITRSGELRREETETAGQPVIYLDSTQGSFIVLPREKIYAESRDVGEISPDATRGNADSRMHTEPAKVKYQKLGTEFVGNRNLTKYKVVNTSSGETVSTDETLIWVDESLGMPLRSERKSNGKSRTTMEVTDISLEVDKKKFELPADYQKVAVSELRRRLHKD